MRWIKYLNGMVKIIMRNPSDLLESFGLDKDE